MNKLGIVWDSLRSKIDWIADKFKWLDDVVVRNSYIPDMVDSIGEHMARLQGLMVDPAVRATETTAQAFRNLASNVSQLLDRLFPEVARLREMYADLDTIDAGVSAGILSGDVAQEARTRIRGEARGTGRAEPRMFDKPMATIDLGKTMEKTIDDLSKKIGLMGEQSKLTTVKIAESFKDMVTKSVQALNSFASAIKGGGFLDILSSAVDLFLQLGSTGLFGKKLATNINRTPGYANGTNFHPGGLAMVGERGPELVSMPRGSKVFTNRETMGMMGGGGGITINVNAKDAVLTSAVKGWVAEGVAIATQGGAQLSHHQAQFHRSRRVA